MTPRMGEILFAVNFRNAGGEWYRARTPGERVTLAALLRAKAIVRRAWRGDGVDRNSAFEYANPTYIKRGILK